MTTSAAVSGSVRSISPPRMTEEAVQRAVAAHLHALGRLDLVWFHPANGGARNKAEAGRFRAMGVRAGVPDLMLFRADRSYALELKAIGGRLSVDQVQCLHDLRIAGVETAVAYGLDEALEVLTRWGLLRSGRK